MLLTATAPRSRYSKKSPTSRRMPAAMTTAFGQGLQPGSEVRRLADDRLFLRRSFADQIADNDQSGSDPHARLEPDRLASRRLTASIKSSPDRTARSASSSCARG